MSALRDVLRLVAATFLMFLAAFTAINFAASGFSSLSAVVACYYDALAALGLDARVFAQYGPFVLLAALLQPVLFVGGTRQ